MTYRCATLFLAAGLLVVRASPPSGYYDTVQGLEGPALAAALHEIIRDHQVVPYSSSSRFDAHDALEILDEDPADTNHVILIYSRRSEPKSTWPSWNREHLWPNSYGLDGVEPAYSDLHNLRAADANVNSARGNEYFDWSDVEATSYVMPGHAEAPLTSSDFDSWEPPDEVKGDIARALFYMEVRYTGDVPGEPVLVLTEDVGQINSATNFMGRLSTLLRWSLEDPVSDAERARNDGVFALQGNRNPFVDHPEYVAAVYLPRLSIEVIPGGVRLRWPVGALPMRVEAGEGWPIVWMPLTNAPVADGAGWRLDLPCQSALWFFRLVN